jgi:hypothetical protein
MAAAGLPAGADALESASAGKIACPTRGQFIPEIEILIT